MFGQVIVLCSIQHVTHHVIGQVSGHVLGHVVQKGVGGHVRVSQNHVVGLAPSALDYRWALGPGFGDLVISGGAGFGFGQSRAKLMTLGKLYLKQCFDHNTSNS